MKKIFAFLLMINLLGLCACNNLGATKVTTPPNTSISPAPNLSTTTSKSTENPNNTEPTITPTPSTTNQLKINYLAMVDVNEDDLNLRAKPSENSDVISWLPKGAIVQVKDVEDGWCYISSGPPLGINERPGWCSQEYLKQINDINALYDQMNAIHYFMKSDGYTIHAYRYKNYIDASFCENDPKYAFTDLFLYDSENNLIDILFTRSSNFMHGIYPITHTGYDSIYIDFRLFDLNEDGKQELLLYCLEESELRNEFNYEITINEFKAFQAKNNSGYKWSVQLFASTNGVFQETFKMFSANKYVNSQYVGKNPFLEENQEIYDKVLKELKTKFQKHIQ